MSYHKLVESRLTPVGKSGNNIIYRCPRCEGNTGSGHLYVDYDKNMYNCFKCSLSGRDISWLVRYLGFDIKLDYDRVTSSSSNRLKEVLESFKDDLTIEVNYSRDLDILTQYYSYHIIPLSYRALGYLHNRGITDDQIIKYHMMEGIDASDKIFIFGDKEIRGKDYSGRVMIPSLRRDNRISFYVGRDYTGMRVNKYVNPPNDIAYASEDVWNLDMVNSNSVIVCEGVFTAITAGGIKGNAVATYGKKIASRSNSDDPSLIVRSQGDKLLDRKFDKYYLAYDADAIDETLYTAKWLSDRGANVYIIWIDPIIYGSHADVDSIGYNEFLKLLNNAEPYSSICRMRKLSSYS